MRKYFFMLLALVAVMPFNSCKDDDDDNERSFTPDDFTINGVELNDGDTLYVQTLMKDGANTDSFEINIVLHDGESDVKLSLENAYVSKSDIYSSKNEVGPIVKFSIPAVEGKYRVETKNCSKEFFVAPDEAKQKLAIKGRTLCNIQKITLTKDNDSWNDLKYKPYSDEDEGNVAKITAEKESIIAISDSLYKVLLASENISKFEDVDTELNAKPVKTLMGKKLDPSQSAGRFIYKKEVNNKAYYMLLSVNEEFTPFETCNLFLSVAY